MAFPTSPNDGDFYNENGVTWLYVSPPGVWTKAGGSPITIDESDPVFLASPAALYTEAPIDGTPYSRQDGGWVPDTGGGYGDADVDTHLNTGTATIGEYLSWNGSDYDWASVPPGYADADVDTHLNTGTATTGQVLGYTGADYDWIDVPATYGDADVDTHLNTSTATANQVLSWSGSDYAWVDDQAGADPVVLPTILLKGDVAYDQDDSLNGYTFTTAGTTPTLNTSDKVYGASSINFPATSSRITTDQTVNIGTQPFCIETWLKPVGIANTEYFASKPPTGNASWLLIVSGVPGILYGGIQRNATSSLSTSAWNHVAFVHDGTNIKVYFNGTEESSAVASSDLGDFVWTIGGTDAGVAAQASWYDGLMDDFRITVGDPVYTGNFTPAEHPIPVANPLGTDETDVTITTPSNGEVLTYDGSKWVNAAGGGLAWELDTGPVGDPIQYAPAGDWLGVQLVGDGYVLGSKSDNASFTCSVSLFGGTTVTYPYHGGMAHYAAAKTVVYGRNEVGLATGNFTASVGIKDSDFVYHSGSTTPKFKCTRSGVVTINNAYTLPTADGTVGQVLTTDGAGASTWADAGGGGGVDGITSTVTGQEIMRLSDTRSTFWGQSVNTTESGVGAGEFVFAHNASQFFELDGLNGGVFEPFVMRFKQNAYSNTDWTLENTSLTPGDWVFKTNLERFRIGSDGVVEFNNAYGFPTADGTANQVLTTNGSGTVTWQDAGGGGIANVVEDTTPQLGGNLDLNGKYIGHPNAYMKAFDFGTGSQFAVYMQGELSPALEVFANASSSIADVTIKNSLQVNGDLEARGTNIRLPNLPTSDPVVAGALWNNAGVLNISAG